MKTATSKTRLCFSLNTQPSTALKIVQTLAKTATYHLSVTFSGLGNAELTKLFLQEYVNRNPFSVLQLSLESGIPSECITFVKICRELKVAPIQCFDLYNRFSTKKDLCFPQQISIYLLCPFEDLKKMHDVSLKNEENGRWTIAYGDFSSIKKAIRTAVKYRWDNGIFVRTYHEQNKDIFALPVYLFFLFRRTVPIRFENMILDQIYRGCLLQEPIAIPEYEAHELLYDDANGIRLRKAFTGLDKETWECLYHSLFEVLTNIFETNLKGITKNSY